MINSSHDAGSPFEDSIPLISVVLPVYNGEKYLKSSLDSIISQTFTNFELIAIDDGSNDSSLSILKNYERMDSRVRVISRENKGLSISLNEGIDASRAELIARMDQDDISLPMRLQLQYSFMQKNPDVVASGSAAIFIDEDAESICSYHPYHDDQRLRNSFPDSPFIHPTVIFRKSKFDAAGKYPEKMLLGGEDVVIFARLSKLGKLGNLEDPLIKYRLVTGSLSRKPPKFRSILTSIIWKEINGNDTLPADFEMLRAEAKKINREQAVFDCNFEIAKLCVWSGSSRSKTFKYLIRCVNYNMLCIKVYILFIISLLPKSAIKNVYVLIKARNYIACN